MLNYLGIALIAGFILANQNPINADLRKIIGSPFWAAVVSFLVGTLFLSLVTILSSHRLFPTWTFIISQPLWIWMGGLFGVIFLTSNILLFPRLGAVQTVILPILGQVLMGLLIDSFGWFSASRLPLSFLRLLGVLIVLVGVLIAVLLPNLKTRSQQAPLPKNQTSLLPWRVWAIISGVFAAMQQAVNGHLGSLLGSSTQAAFMSFFTGLIVIFLLALLIDRRLPRRERLKSIKTWNVTGGILGALFVLASVIAVPNIGAGLSIMMGLIGQITGSMLVQQFGWWRSPRYAIRIWQVLGIGIMLLGIIFIKFL